jgi:putative hydrolase of the HAD superfamily
MIKNIIFDFGGVLTAESVNTIAKKYTNNPKLFNILDNKYNKEWDLGAINIDEYVNKIASGLSIEERLLIKRIVEIFPKDRKLNDQMINLIKCLKKHGYKVYLLSNNNIVMYNYFVKSELVKIFDGFVISAKVHLIKPNKEIYEYLFNKYNINPQESLFIDDKKENIAGALNCKMDGYVFTNYDNLIKYLKARSINY